MAIESGRNVIVEKPIEIKLDRIDRMIETAKKHNVKLAGIFQNRWNSANRTIKDAVDEGRFGRLAWAGCFTPWYRTDQYYRDGGWRGTWALDGGGAIMNQSVHAVDMIQWFAGPVKVVSAYASSRIHAEIEVEDTLTCALQFQSGAFGSIMGSTAMYPGGGVRYEIGGENGTAVADGVLKRFNFREERPTDAELVASGGKPTTTGGGASATDVSLDMHGHNIHHILTAWAEGKEADTNGVEARKAVAIILAMYESARKNGAPVEVK
jgi:predicted dehydrogenase